VSWGKRGAWASSGEKERTCGSEERGIGGAFTIRKTIHLTKKGGRKISILQRGRKKEESRPGLCSPWKKKIQICRGGNSRKVVEGAITTLGIKIPEFLKRGVLHLIIALKEGKGKKRSTPDEGRS